MSKIFEEMDRLAEQKALQEQQTQEDEMTTENIMTQNNMSVARETFDSGAVRDSVDYRYDLMSPVVANYFFGTYAQLANQLLSLSTTKAWNSVLSKSLLRELDHIRCYRTDGINVSIIHLYAQALHEGASKNGERNWEKGISESNLVNHALFHLFKLNEGDTSENHLSHLVWNVMTIIHFREQDRKEKK